MKKNYTLSFLFLLLSSAFYSQAAVLTITYDATQGVSGLSGASQVYMHSGANDVTGPLNSGSWKYVIGNWGQSDGIGAMYSIGNNKWRISIDPMAYYSQASNGPVKGTSIKRIVLVFRNDLGNLEGKDANNSDIFIDLSGANPAVFNSDGSPFGGVVATYNASLSSSTSKIYRYLSVWHIDDSLKLIDTATFNVLRSVKLNADSPVVGATGFSRHPITGEYYAVVRFQTLGNRCLAKINPNNGDVTVIGNLLDRFANITFLSSGKLVGVTGEGALTPESLFSIDITNANTTFIRTLGNGSSGEAIGYCEDNGKIYHRSGIGTQVFEAIDTVNFNITPITQSGNATNGETYCLHYIGNSKFIATSSESGGGKAYYVDTNGVFTFKTLLNQPYKGFSTYSCVRNIVGPSSFCSGASALLTATPGATAYQWYKNGQAISGANAMTYNVTSAGKYNCHFTDLCGADTLSTSIVIQQNPLPIVNITGASSFCEGGSVQLTGSGGGTSQWYKNGIAIPGATSSTFITNSVGSYNMIKTNTNGCADSAAVGKTISMDPKPQLNIVDVVNLTCFNNGSGSIDASISSGTSPYVYSWSNGASSLSINSLNAGTYQLFVNDSKSCKDTLSVSISEPAELLVTVNTFPPLCQNSSDGAAEAIVQGGTGSVTYSWSNGSNTSQANNLTVGFHLLTVTDSNGCVNSQNFQILGPPAIAVQVNTIDVSCFGASNGTASALATGGTGAYTYSWSNGASSSSINGLASGVVFVVATDANLCESAPIAASIGEPSALQISVQNDSVTCFGFTNGAATANVSGGVGPYTYSWSNGDLTPGISQLSVGTYQVFVQDSNGCQTNFSTTIEQPLPISIDTVVTSANNQQNNGQIAITVSGGTDPYSYNWNNGATTQNLTNLAPGRYAVTIIDFNGCVFNSDTISLYGVGINSTLTESSFFIYPNPSRGLIQISSNEKAVMLVYNALNQLIDEFPVEQSKFNNYQKMLKPGVYFLAKKGAAMNRIKLIITD